MEDVVDDDDGPPPYDSHDFDRQDSPPAGRHVQISGLYTIFDSQDFESDLKLVLDQATQQIWGHFMLGGKTGVIRVDNISGITDGQTLSFGWRSEDEQDGRLKFGRGCDGSIRFDGEGRVDGCFYRLDDGEDVEFGGDLHDDEKPDVRELRHTWDDFPRRGYGRA
jgi:hypothetical protein